MGGIQSTHQLLLVVMAVVVVGAVLVVNSKQTKHEKRPWARPTTR